MRTALRIGASVFAAIVGLGNDARGQEGGVVTAPGPNQVVSGEFRRTGAGFACSGPKIILEIGERYCLRYGPLRVGMTRAEAEAVLGKPSAETRDQDGEVFVYATEDMPVGKATTAPQFIALSFDAEEKVSMLQSSGRRRQRDWSFSSIHLADSDDLARNLLGEPFSKSPVAENGAELWAYGPWPFTFEVKDHRVVSIRLQPN